MMTRNPAACARIATLAVLVAGATVPVWAHHSQTMFNLEQTVTYQGTISEVSWTNPHVIVVIDGTQVGAPNASSVHLTIEGTGPGALKRAGWTKESLKVGDKVTVAGNPRRDAKPMLLLVSITLPDGRQMNAKAPAQQ
jgi:hypothetical protein